MTDVPPKARGQCDLQINSPYRALWSLSVGPLQRSRLSASWDATDAVGALHAMPRDCRAGTGSSDCRGTVEEHLRPGEGTSDLGSMFHLLRNVATQDISCSRRALWTLCSGDEMNWLS